jgi:hypothetical protein
MPLFICRWQNGDFSVVNAASRDEAMELLDEVGNADVAALFTAKNFMAHFQLKTEIDNAEDGMPVELEGFGEETFEMICRRIYPVYDKASSSVIDDLPTSGDVPKEKRDAALKTLNDALITERMREWDSKKPKLSDDPEVAELQQHADVPRPMAEQAVKERRRRAVTEMPSKSDKVQ